MAALHQEEEQPGVPGEGGLPEEFTPENIDDDGVEPNVFEEEEQPADGDNAEPGCEDSANGATDSYGDGCEWYDDYPSGCGMYDTEEFSSYDMCCSC